MIRILTGSLGELVEAGRYWWDEDYGYTCGWGCDYGAGDKEDNGLTLD